MIKLLRARQCAISLLALMFAHSCALFAQQQSVPNSSSSYRDLVRALRSPDGLHKAALLDHGHFSSPAGNCPWNEPRNLSEVIDASEQIFIAEPIGKQSFLVNEGRGINTTYSLRVLRVLKGAVSVKTPTMFRLWSGQVTFSDGTTAEQLDIVGKLEQGHRYLLMTHHEERYSELSQAVIAQSIYELNKNGMNVVPLSTCPFDTLKTVTDLGQKHFLAVVTDTIAKESSHEQR